jgi:hypothetical protein
LSIFENLFDFWGKKKNIHQPSFLSISGGNNIYLTEGLKDLYSLFLLIKRLQIAGNPGLQKSKGFPARSSESRVAEFLIHPALRAG